VGPGITLGMLVVVRVLHEVCVGWGGCPGGFVWWQHDAGVNLEDEEAWIAKAGHDCWDTWAQWAADI
jgi:hypothetical protein